MKQDSTRVVFTKPLEVTKKVATKWGNISHDSLIGKSARDIVRLSTGREFRLHFPTLEEYVTLTPRLVTPVYPADANLIVSLLDIHVSPQKSRPEDLPLEILEAGTGHGALTLHLARAIHGANPSPPPELLMAAQKSTEESLPETDTSPLEDSLVLDEKPTTKVELLMENTASELTLQNLRSSRGAVIHTVDISAKRSQHAEKVFRGFRQGIYTGDADFYVGDVSKWIDQQFALRGPDGPQQVDRAFLSHLILDLPDSYKHVAKAASALRTDGAMIVFNPSITQIMACVKLIRSKKLPLVLDHVIELGAGMTGGKEWDIRTVKPRALLKKEKAEEEAVIAVGDAMQLESGGSEEREGEGEEQFEASNEEQTKVGKQGDTGWEMICRPKAGARVVGGGFLGVWRKMKYSEGTSEK
ncbi:hypothetical protein MMC30_000299 [Trapelia coarctata]|nr:hypothetical protein [Trapelia coarctata]